MEVKKRIYFNWSTGKDASLALHYLQKDKSITVDRLLTSVNAHHNRVSMHGLRRSLLEKQTEALGLPLTTIELPEEPSMEIYNRKMKQAVEDLLAQGYKHTAFGDIFLEDLRQYRESHLEPLGISCTFPLWKKDTRALLEEFLELGFKAIIICINARLLDQSFAGRIIDEKFLDDLPENVDPCGENGEFHTFCFDGPIFNKPVSFKVGEKIYREYKSPDGDDIHEEGTMGFWFCDLLSEEE